MKPVYKCDYCSYTGTEEEVKAHEEKCFNNYDRRNCRTCEHRKIEKSALGNFQYKCDAGKEIPVNHMIEFCNSYEKKDTQFSNGVYDIFSGLGLFGKL